MIRRVVCIVASLVGCAGFVRAADAPAPAAPAPAGQFDSLIKSSPFGQAAPAAGAQGAPAGPLEFRGVFQDKGEYYFSLHEAGSRTGSWVGLKETGQPFVVDSYDVDKGSINVKYRGQILTLALKLAQVIVQAPPPVAQAPVAVATATPAIAANPGQSDEAVRLAQVAEEIRRRRALRAPQLPQPGPMIQPNAPASPSRPYTPPTRP